MRVEPLERGVREERAIKFLLRSADVFVINKSFEKSQNGPKNREIGSLWGLTERERTGLQTCGLHRWMADRMKNKL